MEMLTAYFLLRATPVVPAPEPPPVEKKRYGPKMKPGVIKIFDLASKLLSEVVAYENIETGCTLDADPANLVFSRDHWRTVGLSYEEVRARIKLAFPCVRSTGGYLRGVLAKIKKTDGSILPDKRPRSRWRTP
jgi:hypothetical protein